MAVCPHKGLDLPTIHSELIISKMVYSMTNAYLKIGSFSELQHAVLHKAVRPCKQLLNNFCKRQTSPGAQTSLRKPARVAFSYSHSGSGDDLAGKRKKTAVVLAS